ncbi:MAG: aminotransferase, partial [Nocardioides sp.]
IDVERSHEFEREITGGCEGIKPGWVRINFNYFVSDAVVDYLIESVRLIATEGWRLLGDYCFNPATGLWRHRVGVVAPPLSLHDISYAGGRVSMPRHAADATGGEELLAEHLRESAAILAAAPEPDLDSHPGNVSADFEHLRWFDLPSGSLLPVEDGEPARGER